MADVATHLTAGTLAGMTGVLVDYPLDTIKTRMQVRCATYPNSYLQCATGLYQQGGLQSFYRGLSVPFAAQGAEAAIIFTVYNAALTYFKEEASGATVTTAAAAAAASKSHMKASRQQSNAFSSVWSSSCYWKAAGCAGLAVSVVLTPVEMLKCNLQTASVKPTWQRRQQPPLGVRQLARDVFNAEGLRGFYRGFAGTVTRAVLGNVAYFLSYEQSKQWLTHASQPPAGEGIKIEPAAPPPIPAWASFIAGGVSGSLYWSIAYPADVIKTQMQVCPQASADGFGRTFQRLLRAGGLRGLYRGLAVTTVRAFLSSAVVFTTYERCAATLRSLEVPPYFQEVQHEC